MSAPSKTKTLPTTTAKVAGRTVQAQQGPQVPSAHTAGGSDDFQPKTLTRSYPIAKQDGDSPAMIAQRINGGKSNNASTKSSLLKATGGATGTATKD